MDGYEQKQRQGTPASPLDVEVEVNEQRSALKLLACSATVADHTHHLPEHANVRAIEEHITNGVTGKSDRQSM